MKFYAISLKEDGCDYTSAAEARRGLLRNDPFRMCPTNFDMPCPVVHEINWDKRRASDLPDKTLVTINFLHRHGSKSHQITVQLGRCIICGDRIDLGKSPACFEEHCQKEYKKQLAKAQAKTNGKAKKQESAKSELRKLLKNKTKEEILAILAKE